ncbi:hypothetical protein P8452_08549 [Trifolium repens]|nr:hypothetical protein P8452_08549 [Trifolium repens]
MYSLANGLVNKGIISTIKKETRIGASLLRLQLHFHDCFVNVVMHQFCWMIQAIETHSFIRFVRGDQYAIALALLHEGKVVLGVLACPNLPPATIGSNQ